MGKGRGGRYFQLGAQITVEICSELGILGVETR